MKRFWTARVVRRSAAVVIAVAVGGGEYLLVNIPQPLKLERESVTASKDRTAIILALPPTEQPKLLSFDGKKDTVLDVVFEQASLAPASSLLLAATGRIPPTGEHAIAYRTLAPAAGGRGRVCQSFVEIERAEPKRPSELHLFQQGLAGEDRFRELSLRIVGSAAVVRLKTEFDPAGRSDDPGCRKNLLVGDWRLPVSNVPLTMTVPDGRAIRLTLQPASEAASFRNDPGALVSAFRLADPGTATEVRLGRMNAGPGSQSEPLRIRPDGGTTLAASGLGVGSNKVQVAVDADRAWMWREGKRSTYSLLERIQKYPLASFCIGGLNAALLAYLRRLFFGRPGTKPQRHRRHVPRLHGLRRTA